VNPLLDDPDVLVTVFSNEAGTSVRLVHVPSGIVVETAHERIGSIAAKEQAAAALQGKLISEAGP
jgi:protein subunit release factor A